MLNNAYSLPFLRRLKRSYNDDEIYFFEMYPFIVLLKYIILFFPEFVKCFLENKKRKINFSTYPTFCIFTSILLPSQPLSFNNPLVSLFPHSRISRKFYDHP